MRAKEKSDDVTVCAGAGSPSNGFLMLDSKRNDRGLSFYFMFSERLLYPRNHFGTEIGPKSSL